MINRKRNTIDIAKLQIKTEKTLYFDESLYCQQKCQRIQLINNTNKEDK